MGEPRRRRWLWLLLLALLLLAGAVILYARLAPPPRPDGHGAPFATSHRVAVLATLEGGWLAFIAAIRSALLDRAGFIGRALRIIALTATFAGLGVAAAGGWLTWSFLSSDVHGTEHHGRWDWDD